MAGSPASNRADLIWRGGAAGLHILDSSGWHMRASPATSVGRLKRYELALQTHSKRGPLPLSEPPEKTHLTRIALRGFGSPPSESRIAIADFSQAAAVFRDLALNQSAARAR